MKIPIIRLSGGHIVGTNSHDRLYIKDNAIHYLTTQSLAATENREDGIEFEGVLDWVSEDITGVPSVEFIDVEELVEVAISHCKDSTESQLRLRKALKRYKSIKKRCKRKLSKFWNTGGELL